MSNAWNTCSKADERSKLSGLEHWEGCEWANAWSIIHQSAETTDQKISRTEKILSSASALCISLPRRVNRFQKGVYCTSGKNIAEPSRNCIHERSVDFLSVSILKVGQGRIEGPTKHKRRKAVVIHATMHTSSKQDKRPATTLAHLRVISRETKDAMPSCKKKFP